MNWLNFMNQLAQWIYMILKLTGIWWLFNLPYVLIGALLLLAPDVGSIHTLNIIGIILLPFVAIPSTVATLAIARRYMKEDDVFPLLQVFWSYYKREYKKSMVVGCLSAVIWIVFYLALRYYAGISSLLAIVFYMLVVLTPFFFMYVYSFLVDQKLPLKSYLTNTLFLLLMHPLNTFLMILDAIVIAYVLWVVFPPLLVFIYPGFIALIVTYFYQKSMDVEIEKWERHSKPVTL